MKLSDVHIVCLPLTDRICVATINAHDRLLINQKEDRTSDFCRALLQWCEPGKVREIKASTGETYEVVVRLASSQATPQAPEGE